jgi:transcriptional regulator with XRE-family HTH domain
MKHKTRAPGSLDLHFGEKMRSRRVMMVPKVSQTDVGDALGLTFQQIQKYEKGTNRISAAMLVRIAAVLKVDVQYFFDELPSSAKNGKGIKTPVLIEMSLAYPRRCVMNSGSGQFRLPVAAPDRMSVCWPQR